MSPKAIAAAGLSAIALAASGCSGDSDPEAEFRAAFKEQFEAQPWYQRITGIEVKDSGLEITTDLDPKSDYETGWGPICRPAYGVAIESGAIDGGEGVRVMDRDGVELGGCA